jgi:hypothetical protein
MGSRQHWCVWFPRHRKLVTAERLARGCTQTAPCYHLVWYSEHNAAWWHSESTWACWASLETANQPTDRQTDRRESKYWLFLAQFSSLSLGLSSDWIPTLKRDKTIITFSLHWCRFCSWSLCLTCNIPFSSSFLPSQEIISEVSAQNTNKFRGLSLLYRPKDRRLLAKLVSTFADIKCCMVSATDPHGRILGFLDRSHY